MPGGVTEQTCYRHVTFLTAPVISLLGGRQSVPRYMTSVVQSDQAWDHSLSESVTVERSARLRPMCAVLAKNGLACSACLPVHAQPRSSHDWDLLCL